MEKKYVLTDETKVFCGVTLHRIKAIRGFGHVKPGELGGWVEKEENLSHEGSCFVYGEAMVYGNAKIFGNAKVYDRAKVYDEAKVFGESEIFDNAEVYGNAEVSVYAGVCGNAKVYGYAKFYGKKIVKYGDYVNTPTSIARSDGYNFTLQSNGRILAGCRDFSPEEADVHWGNPKHHLHEESMAIVNSLRLIQKARMK